MALDYDIANPDDQAILVKTLDELKEAAAINEAADADPNPTTDPSVSAQELTDPSRTSPEGHASSHDLTSATSELSNLNIAPAEGSLGAELEHLSDAEKRKYLKDLFPGTDNSKIQSILATAGTLQGAIDELLNLAFLSTYGDDTADHIRPPAKGVDDFAEELRPDRGRKRRNKKKNRTTESSRTNSTSSYGTTTPPTSNIWANASEDVEYICSRTILSPQVVTSLYHRKSAVLADTIRELADQEKTKLPPFDVADPIVQMQVAELKEDFPDISASRIQALLHLARNIPSATYELLEAMIDRPTGEAPTGKLQGVVHYAPVKLEEENAAWTSVTRGSAGHMSYGADHGHAANQAFGQASSAARRAKSDRLMGGVAAYYASVGHEHIKMAKAQSSAAADALVAQQSTRTMIDLHGVSVSDAVRIANHKTEAWWQGLGDAKYTTGGGGPVRAGFQIVTGVGTHSRNNAPRIGPAVAKALVREGWRVEVGHGEMYVTGKARR